MGRLNKRRKISHFVSCKKEFSGYYYPIYKGWVTKITPIFVTASAAVCFQISQFRRNLLLHNTIKQPSWINCVGSIHPSDFVNIEPLVFDSKSLIERSYFENVNFLKFTSNSHVKSRLVRIVSQTFLSCQETMKDNTDYQSSSISIYKPGSFCVEEQNVKSMSHVFDKKGICQKRDENDLIATVLNAKNLVLHPDMSSNTSIVEKLINSAKGYKSKDIIVSIGSGSGITEMSSQKLTLCIDINKRSIFAGMGQMKGQIYRNRTIFAVMDCSENLCKLLNEIKVAFPVKTIRVLVQHPNPSIDDTNLSKLKLILSAFKMSLEIGTIHDVKFVYDFSPNRNTWSQTGLVKLFMHNVEESKYKVTDEINRSSIGSRVDHPLFGDTK